MLPYYRLYGPPRRCPAWAVELTAIISGVLSVRVELLLTIMAIGVITEFIKGRTDAWTKITGKGWWRTHLWYSKNKKKNIVVSHLAFILSYTFHMRTMKCHTKWVL